MKILKFVMRIWITVGSTGGFMAGWILLAHSPKPAQSASPAPAAMSAPLPTLAPLPALNFGGGSSGPAFQFQAPAVVVPPPQPQASMPIFRTSGS